MGMPITIEVVDKTVREEDIEKIFSYFTSVDETFSTYKKTSEISQFNAGVLPKNKLSNQVKKILQLAGETKQATNGYFDIYRNSSIDPSGIVKGWAIAHAAQLLRKKGFSHFFIDAGGDIQVSGKNAQGRQWTVGIRNPFNREEIVKVLVIEDHGVATSGTYIRGQHIYNPHRQNAEITDIVSLTVIGPNIYEADRFATAAFAMGKEGIRFIEGLEGFEGYMIDKNGIATMSRGFSNFVRNPMA